MDDSRDDDGDSSNDSDNSSSNDDIGYSDGDDDEDEDTEDRESDSDARYSDEEELEVLETRLELDRAKAADLASTRETGERGGGLEQRHMVVGSAPNERAFHFGVAGDTGSSNNHLVAATKSQSSDNFIRDFGRRHEPPLPAFGGSVSECDLSSMAIEDTACSTFRFQGSTTATATTTTARAGYNNHNNDNNNNTHRNSTITNDSLPAPHTFGRSVDGTARNGNFHHLPSGAEATRGGSPGGGSGPAGLLSFSMTSDDLLNPHRADGPFLSFSSQQDISSRDTAMGMDGSTMPRAGERFCGAWASSAGNSAGANGTNGPVWTSHAREKNSGIVAVSLMRVLRSASGQAEARLRRWAGSMPAEEQAFLGSLLRTM